MAKSAMRGLFCAVLIAGLWACGQDAEKAAGKPAAPLENASPDIGYSTDEPPLETGPKTYGENCFGIDARAALGLLGADGGEAQMIKGAGAPTCHFMDASGKPVATITVVAADALASRSSLDAKALAALQTAASTGQASSRGPTETSVLAAQGKDGAAVNFPLYLTGWGAAPKGEIAFTGGANGAVLVRFDGPSKVQARQFMEQAAVKAGL